MFKFLVRTIFALAFLGLMALNIAIFTVQGVAAAVSGVVSVVTGTSAILPEFQSVKYRGKSVKLSSAASDTSRRIAARTARGAARNVGSVFAEALPVVGIGAVVGVTTWELRDACETMKDLQALEMAAGADMDAGDEASLVCGLVVPTKDEVWKMTKTSPGKAWELAKAHVPDLPDWSAPNLNWELPEIDWSFWN